MKRSQCEIIRLRHSISRMRACIDSIARNIDSAELFGAECVEALTSTAVEVSMQIAKHDAYLTAEKDAQYANTKEEA